MISELKTIEAKAMALPAEDRERLASDLFKSLNTEEPNELDLAWMKIAEKRYQALKDGNDLGLSEDSFFASLT